MSLKPGLVVREAPVDRETMAHLESLGYVGETDLEEDANDVPETQPTTAPATAPHEGEHRPLAGNDDEP